MSVVSYASIEHQKTISLTASTLRCLLAIWQLSQQSHQVSSREIAASLRVKPPTVCRLLEPLIEKGMVKKEPYGKVELTLTGKQAAIFRHKRVALLKQISMKRLGLDPEAAMQAAIFFASSMNEETQQSILRSATQYRKEAIP